MNLHSGNLSPDKLNPRAVPFVSKKASPGPQDIIIPTTDLKKLNKNAQPFEPKKIGKETNKKKNQEVLNISESNQPIKAYDNVIKDNNNLQKSANLHIESQLYQAHPELQPVPSNQNMILISGKEDKIPENENDPTKRNPINVISNPSESSKSEIFETDNRQMIRINKDDLFSAFNPLKETMNTNEVSENSNIISEEKNEIENKTNEESSSNSKLYDIEFLLSFKKKWKKAPYHMNFVDVPIKSKDVTFPVPSIIHNETEYNPVKEIRILLNTIAEENYEKIADKIVNEFEYNIHTLDALAKLLFNKSIKEPSYVDLYLRLCYTLFRKFKKHNEEKGENPMSFRKLFISRVQNLFQGEDEEKVTIDKLPEIIDNEEKQYKKRQKIFGNIRLIGELFVRGLIDDRVLKLCFKRILSRKKIEKETDLKIIEEHIENACILFKLVSVPILSFFYMKSKGSPEMSSIDKLGNVENQISSEIPFEKSLSLPKLSVKEMTLEYFEKYLDRLIDYQLNPEISSRIKFMIQYIIEMRELTLNKFSSNCSIKSEAKEVNNNNNRNEEQYGIKNNNSNSLEEEKRKINNENINKVVSNEISEDDKKLLEENILLEKKLDKEMKRKESLDEGNVIGVNLEPYRKQSIDNRLKIQNLINEYIASGDKNEALLSFKEFKEVNKIDTFTSFGLLINDCICRKQSEFKITSLLICDIISLKMVSDEDILQGILIVFAKLYDNLIDFPYSKINLLELLNRIKDLSQEVSKNYLIYVSHISEVEKQ